MKTHARRSLCAAGLAVLAAALSAAPAAAQRSPLPTPPTPVSAVPGPPEVARDYVDEAPPADPGASAAPTDLLTALQGGAGGLTASQVAARAVETAPGLERARAAADAANAAATRASFALIPRLELSARYTRLSSIEATSLSFSKRLTDAEVAGLRGLVGAVADPPAQALLGGIVEGQIASANGPGFSFPVVLNQYAFHAGLTVPVSDMFLTILPAYRASQRFAEAAEAQSASAQQSVALQAREAFYGYARARASLAVAQLAVSQVEAHRRDVEAFVSAGTVAAVELQRIEAQAAAARVGLARTAGAVAIAAVALRTLTHDPALGAPGIGEDLLSDMPPIGQTPDQLVASAMERRAEMRALRFVITGREGLTTVRRMQGMPHVAIAANADYSNPNQRYTLAGDVFNGTWDVSAVLSWSPNDFLNSMQDASSASAELAQARADLASLEDGLRIEVQQAYESYNASRDALAAARLGEAASAEAYRIRQERFRAGAAVTTDIIDADAELSRARLDLVNAAIDLRVADARLRRATGEDVSR
jgi:outer membrane protein TolC